MGTTRVANGEKLPVGNTEIIISFRGKRAEQNMVALFKSMKDCFGQRRRNQFLVFTVHKKKHNGFKLLWGRWLLGIRRDFPIVRTAKHWNELPATFPSWEALQKTV